MRLLEDTPTLELKYKFFDIQSMDKLARVWTFGGRFCKVVGGYKPNPRLYVVHQRVLS